VEIPLTAKALAESGTVDAVVTLGAVIRGETSHYDHVCRLVADGCGSSLEFGSAKAQLDYLSTLDKPTRGGSVFGTAVLRRELQRPGSGHNTETAWSPVETRMRLTGGRSTRTAMTDGGKFRFDGLPAGTYSLRITVPPTLTEWVGPERSVTLPDTHACAAVGFSFSERPR